MLNIGAELDGYSGVVKMGISDDYEIVGDLIGNSFKRTTDNSYDNCKYCFYAYVTLDEIMSLPTVDTAGFYVKGGPDMTECNSFAAWTYLGEDGQQHEFSSDFTLLKYQEIKGENDHLIISPKNFSTNTGATIKHKLSDGSYGNTYYVTSLEAGADEINTNSCGNIYICETAEDGKYHYSCDNSTRSFDQLINDKYGEYPLFYDVVGEDDMSGSVAALVPGGSYDVEIYSNEGKNGLFALNLFSVSENNTKITITRGNAWVPGSNAHEFDYRVYAVVNLDGSTDETEDIYLGSLRITRTAGQGTTCRYTKDDSATQDTYQYDQSADNPDNTNYITIDITDPDCSIRSIEKIYFQISYPV